MTSPDGMVTIEIGGITATSTSNTFTDVVPGITIVLGSQAIGSADIDVSRDAGSRSTAVKTLVADVNALLGQISGVTATGKTPGALAGDSTLRRVGSALQNAIYPTDGTSMARFGIQTDRYGKLTFDEEVFAKAYAADPTAVTAAFTGANGFASRLQAVAETASDKYNGSVTNAITSRDQTINRLNDSIERWDDRLALRRTTLERQYTALETALSHLQGQSSWLSSQLASLSASNS